ncbi:MAG: TonB family protein, partial [Myxococcota bacterium]|nr:TonB family protein [Myxococcota bacterium]
APMVVPLPPQPRIARTVTPTATRIAATPPTTPAKRLRASALPALKLSYSGLGLSTALPTLGNIGLEQMDIPESTPAPNRPPRARRTIAPVYPRSARRDGIEGYVVVRLSIDSKGRVNHVIVVDAEPMGVFEQSARDAARRFEFEPAEQNGAPTQATLEKKIVFTLR